MGDSDLTLQRPPAPKFRFQNKKGSLKKNSMRICIDNRKDLYRQQEPVLKLSLENRLKKKLGIKGLTNWKFANYVNAKSFENNYELFFQNIFGTN